MKHLPNDGELERAALESAQRLTNEPLERNAAAPIQRSIKCALVPAFLGRSKQAVVVKYVFDDDLPWRWYMKRERAVLEHLATHGRGIAARIPRVIEAGDDVLVLEQLAGSPLARRRHDDRALDDSIWDALVLATQSIASVPLPIEESELDDETRAALRRRLLEDPTSPIAWMTDGLRRGAEQGAIASGDAERIADVLLLNRGGIAFAHGDLLLRNVLWDGESLGLVDWECSGAYVAGWDAALLWVFASAKAREALQAVESRCEVPEQFFACVAYALVREIVFRRDRQTNDRVRDRLRRDLELVLREVSSRSTEAI